MIKGIYRNDTKPGGSAGSAKAGSDIKTHSFYREARCRAYLPLPFGKSFVPRKALNFSERAQAKWHIDLSIVPRCKGLGSIPRLGGGLQSPGKHPENRWTRLP